eukprot:Lithocolla_globosa_v1_NODE_87_length_6640_cov_111.536826.p6 type:complete len:170 gc:universal NODE_87_length_6640_cov_111.536826:5760-6269(+)
MLFCFLLRLQKVDFWFLREQSQKSSFFLAYPSKSLSNLLGKTLVKYFAFLKKITSQLVGGSTSSGFSKKTCLTSKEVFKPNERVDLFDGTIFCRSHCANTYSEDDPLSNPEPEEKQLEDPRLQDAPESVTIKDLVVVGQYEFFMKQINRHLEKGVKPIPAGFFIVEWVG